jgi:hypothetical protein
MYNKNFCILIGPFTRLGVAFLPSCIAQQCPLGEWPDQRIFAGIAGLNDRAYIILLKELLSIDQNEREVLQDQSFALLNMENVNTCNLWMMYNGR